MGVNVSKEFMGLVEQTFHCRVGSILFMYMGLHVGANPRNYQTWMLIVGYNF